MTKGKRMPVRPTTHVNAGVTRTSLVLVIHELAPYRVNVLRRFRRELNIGQLHVMLTCQTGGFTWQITRPEGILWHEFGAGFDIASQGRLSQYVRERRKGQQLCHKLDALHPSAVIVCGYGDAAHRHIIRHCYRRSIPVLLWADSNISSEPSRGVRRVLKHLLLPRLLARCSAVLPWGSLGKQYFLKYGVAENRIFIVSPEPDYATIENTPPADIEAARQRLSLLPDRKRMLYVGRLAPEKRLDLLIQAFAQLAGDRPDWDLLIVGDGPLRQQLHAMVPESLQSRVTWAGAMTTPQSLSPLYHLGDIFVLPSDHEPWGIVVNEAAAAGLPLVCSDIVGAAGDLLQQPLNGRLFRRGEVDDLAQVLKELTAMSSLAPMGEKSRDIVSQWRRMADPVEGLRRALANTGAA